MAKKKSARPSAGKSASQSQTGRTAMPELLLRSPLAGPQPSPTEEVMLDLGQLTGSRVYNSVEDLSKHLARLTGAGPIPRSEPTDPRAQAQRLVYDAWRTCDGSGVALAQQALALDPDCADAHLFLAATFVSADTVLERAFEAVKAGERSLGPEGETFADEGTLWGHLPARPYLRARAFLARQLWSVGGRLSAVTLVRESLELDETDALGLRYVLLAWYLDMGEEMLSRDLLSDSKTDRSTFFLYGDALLAFWELSEERTATTRLKRALKANRHVPQRILFGLPDPLKVLATPSYRPGSGEEADICAFLLAPAWERDIAAIDWLQEVAGVPLPGNDRGTEGSRSAAPDIARVHPKME